MKPFSLLLICITLLAACSKEEESSFEANEALIDPSSAFYLIADVEGLEGISKINYQTPVINPSSTTYPCVLSQTANGACPNGSVQFESSIIYFVSSTSYKRFSVNFRKICSSSCTMPDIVKTGPATLLGSDSSPDGPYVMFVNYDANPGLSEAYVSYFASNPDAALEVISLEEQPSSLTTHVVKVRFNISLAPPEGKTIKIKNAVFKGVIGY